MNSQRYSTALKGVRYTSQDLRLQAYRQQFLDNTQTGKIPCREISLLYVKRHKLPIEDIHKDPTKEAKARQSQQRKEKARNNPTLIPRSQFCPYQGGSPIISVIKKPSTAQSIVIIGVLLRRASVLLRMGLLSLSLQGTNSRHVCQPSRNALIGANAAGTGLIDVHVPSSPSGAEAPVAERSGTCTSIVPCLVPGVDLAYLTRFCVHSRSRFVSRAVFRPSEKFARAPFSRRWASACSSRSSCCFAFSWPDLRVRLLLACSLES